MKKRTTRVLAPSGPVLLTVLAAALGCGGTNLAGDGAEDDVLDGEATPDAGGDGTDRADVPDGTPLEDGTALDDAVPDADVPGDDGGADDGDGSSSHVVGLEPESIEEYVLAEGGETIRPHRHAVPAAFGGASYALVADVELGSVLSVGLYHFDRASRVLRQAWLDEPGGATEYNSICWTGEAFVAALPTSRVGLRVVALGADGTLLREPVVLEPNAAYSPAGAGQPPVVLCPTGGPFVIDHGRGAGGTDRIYHLAADGSYAGESVDANLPAFSTTPFYASTPCAVVDGEAACATETGLAFVRHDGSLRLSDSVASPGICPSGVGCDVALAADGLAAMWTALLTDRLALSFALFSLDGSVAVPPVYGPSLQMMRTNDVHVASSGTTVLASGPGEDVDPMGPIVLYLFDTSGTLLGSPIAAGECSGGPSDDPDCTAFPMGGSSTTPLFWEGDAYAALWVPEGPWAIGALAYRRFRLIEP